jgi:hypothetical protein
VPLLCLCLGRRDTTLRDSDSPSLRVQNDGRTGTGAHLAGVGGMEGEGGIGEIYGKLCPSHAGSSGDHFVSCLVAGQLSVDFNLSMGCR